jgi:hypothetical protein
MQRSFVLTFLLCTIVLPVAHGFPTAGSLDQQLSAQYPPGTVLVVRLKGVEGVNPACPALLLATYKEDGKLHAPSVLQKTAAAGFGCLFRSFPVGWKVNSQSILVVPRSGRIWFVVQECDACNGGMAASYRARVDFQFSKGSFPDAGAVKDAISQVFSIDNTQSPPPPPPLTTPPVLGSVYASSQNNADRLQLNAGNAFALQEGGQSFSGTYAVNGNTLTLHIVQLSKDVEIVIDGSRLLVNGDEVWTQPGQ